MNSRSSRCSATAASPIRKPWSCRRIPKICLEAPQAFPSDRGEQRGGLMASDSDFRQITQLLEIKRSTRSRKRSGAAPHGEGRGVNKYMMELRISAGSSRDGSGPDRPRRRQQPDEVRQRKAQREFQQKIAQLNERIQGAQPATDARRGGEGGGGARRRVFQEVVPAFGSPGRRSGHRMRACDCAPYSSRGLLRVPDGRTVPADEALLQAEKLLGQKKYAEAETSLREILRTDPSNARAHGNLALALLSSRRPASHR